MKLKFHKILILIMTILLIISIISGSKDTLTLIVFVYALLLEDDILEIKEILK